MATILPSSSTTTSSPFPVRRHVGPQPRPVRTVWAAAKRDGHRGGGGGLVDEDMIVLRKRIHEAEMAERNYQPPAGWAEWEKQCYARYHADVLEAARWIQDALMSTRPAVAVGVVAVLAASVPAAAILMWLRLVDHPLGIASTDLIDWLVGVQISVEL